MKRIGLILTCIILFAVSLYAAYAQGVDSISAGGHLAAPLSSAAANLNPFWVKYVSIFSGLLNSLSRVFFNNLVAAIVVLALIVELVTLYPAVNLQLKQKKIHLFHKKLVDRFHRGELTMSESKRELDVLYSVNERIHRRGALLVGSQLVVFVLVLIGLNLTALLPSALWGYSGPTGVSLPILASLAYLLHSLVKIHLKQKEDYISMRQIYTSVGFALVVAGCVFYFASVLAVLLTVFFLTQITFATIRYIIVENNAKEWGKYVQRDLIKMLRTAKLHKNKIEHWSRKFHHLPIVRHLNFHLMEEALSMSLAIVMFANGLILM